MISVRSGMGLGDALYLQSVARHLVAQGHRVEACCAWPDVFRPLGDRVKVSPFRRERVDRLAHYTSRKAVAGTDQFQDCCINARINGPVELRLDWKIANPLILDKIAGGGVPIVVVQMPRAPFARTDGYGMELLPDCRVVQRIMDRIGRRAKFVQIGSGVAIPPELAGFDLDLTNRTSVCDVLDIGALADGFLGFVSFIVPLSESLLKPSLLVWSRKGLRSPHQPVRTITPQKILHRESSRWLMDDCTEQELAEAADAFLEQMRSRVAV
jgi:hypothetical protein